MSTLRTAIVALALAVSLCLNPLEVSAQQAVTLQLPTFSFASVGTTVMVPDQGSTFLGGIDRAADSRSEFGVPGLAFPGFQNRGIGQDRSASNFWVSVTIHDFDAMDQALLSTPSTDGLAGTYPSLPRGVSEALAALAEKTSPSKVARLAGNWRVEPERPGPVSDVAAEEASRAARQTARAEAADSFFARGQQAEADGKPNVAKVYYQMALRRAAGDVKQQVQTRLDAVSGRTTALAKSTP